LPSPPAREPVAVPAPAGPPARYALRRATHWWIELPHGTRFDASGLCLTPAGDLLVVADRGPQIYRIERPAQGDTAHLALVAGDPATADPSWRRWLNFGRLDCEGLAADDQGRVYLCEESRRLVLRFTPATGSLESVAVDWSPVANRFSKTDANASFEGIAVGDGRLYLANERQPPLLLSFDLETGRLIESWTAEPKSRGLGPLHYSDLSWRDGHLFVLLRHQRAILELEPLRRTVLAQYDFGEIENAAELRYRRRYPTGVMEGLAVGADCFWLASDNNGEPRVAAPEDRRPVLLCVPRPERSRRAEGGAESARSWEALLAQSHAQ
jgi:hypothetical protein